MPRRSGQTWLLERKRRSPGSSHREHSKWYVVVVVGKFHE